MSTVLFVLSEKNLRWLQNQSEIFKTFLISIIGTVSIFRHIFNHIQSKVESKHVKSCYTFHVLLTKIQNKYSDFRNKDFLRMGFEFKRVTRAEPSPLWYRYRKVAIVNYRFWIYNGYQGGALPSLVQAPKNTIVNYRFWIYNGYQGGALPSLVQVPKNAIVNYRFWI